MTIGAHARAAVERLERAGFAPDEARRDVAVIARALLGWDQSQWLTRQSEPAPETFIDALSIATGRRQTREPVAYIVGEREFYGRRFAVTPAVLIPRPETEIVVEEALGILNGALGTRAEPSVLDVGTGSGCIAITVALECPRARVAAHDISAPALEVARRNADEWHVASRIALRLESLTGSELEAFDVIVSNPPYVALTDRAALQTDVQGFEPEAALYGGDDGLAVVRALLPAAAAALEPGGWFVMEIGAGQAAEARHLLQRTTGLTLDRVVRDLAGIDRVVVARKNRV